MKERTFLKESEEHLRPAKSAKKMFPTKINEEHQQTREYQSKKHIRPKDNNVINMSYDPIEEQKIKTKQVARNKSQKNGTPSKTIVKMNDKTQLLPMEYKEIYHKDQVKKKKEE